MKELTKHEIEAVNGAGVVDDYFNKLLDKPLRDLGNSLGKFAGDTIGKIIDHTGSFIDQVGSFIKNIFDRK